MKKILVIEDDFDIGEIVEMMLGAKYRVLLKRDSAKLVEVILQFEPDIIIMDNYVGEKYAKDMIAEINFSDHKIVAPVILFSAHSDIETIAKKIGASGFIPKPFELNDVHQCVNRVLLAIEQQQYLNI